MLHRRKPSEQTHTFTEFSLILYACGTTRTAHEILNYLIAELLVFKLLSNPEVIYKQKSLVELKRPELK